MKSNAMTSIGAVLVALLVIAASSVRVATSQPIGRGKRNEPMPKVERERPRAARRPKQAAKSAGQTTKGEPRNANEWHQRAEDFRKKGNDQQALDAYNKAFAATGKSSNWLPVSATISAAEIQLMRLEADAALKTLNRYNSKDVAGLSSSWRVRFLRVYGRIYAAQGREADAWAKFREANEVERAQ